MKNILQIVNLYMKSLKEISEIFLIAMIELSNELFRTTAEERRSKTETGTARYISLRFESAR